MRNSKHPPVPPNTKHFVKNDLQGEIFYLPWPKTPASRLDKPINDICVRKIIAAVAIEEWELTTWHVHVTPEQLARKDFQKFRKNPFNVKWQITDNEVLWAEFVRGIQREWRIWGGWRTA